MIPLFETDQAFHFTQICFSFQEDSTAAFSPIKGLSHFFHCRLNMIG